MMYNDEMFDVSDFDEDIKTREALLEEARNMEIPSDWNEANRMITALKRRWKRISYWESAYEDTLADQFEQCFESFYSQRREGYESNQKLKEDLIKEAQKLSESTDWKQTNDAMNELMQQWKAVGSTGKTTDDTLWEAFNTARQTFFDRKRKHWKDVQSNFENAQAVKKDLINKAAELRDSTEWKKASNTYRDLMDQWKAAGNAGREHDDQLWEAFNKERQAFYDRRTAYYDQFNEEQEQRYEQKKALIKQVNEIASAKDYTKENTDKMKTASKDWKDIGFCGKDKEDQMWLEFRAIMDAYFEGLRQWNEDRRTQWRQRMQGARNRKQELILNQKRQIEAMQKEIVGLLGQRAIDEMEEEIKEKQAFIQQLEEELADIDESLKTE